MTTPSLHSISALIPSAGMSSRMHSYKPLLQLGNHTMIERVISLFRQCGIKDIIVITGHNREKIESIIRHAKAKPVFNPDYASGMLGSIQAGASAISPKSNGFFLLPVDIPLIRPSTVLSLISAFAENPAKIVIPEFNGEPGHPPLIPAWLIPEILSLSGDSNLGTLLLSRQEHRKKAIVHDRGILMDADTREAYEHLKKKNRTLEIPDTAECRSIINATLGNEKTIKAHMNRVAEIALQLARAVQAGYEGQKERNHPPLDMSLITAGAGLHDIKRKEKNHAAVGGRYLLELGFPKVADIVAQHMDVALPLPEHLTEAQIVYFADKLCHSDQLDMAYEKRFRKKMAAFPHARNKILNRYENTRRIQTRIEAISGRSVASILDEKTSYTVDAPRQDKGI